MNADRTMTCAVGRTTRRPLRRRLGTGVAVAVSLACLALGLLAPPAVARSGQLSGTWTSVDLDGSHQQLRIRGAGSPVYAMTLRDDLTTGACGGPPAKVVGHGVVVGGDLRMVGTLVCLHGGNPVPAQRITIHFVHDESADTLTDPSGVVWSRSG